MLHRLHSPLPTPLPIAESLFAAVSVTTKQGHQRNAHRARYEGPLFLLFLLRTPSLFHIILGFFGFHPNYFSFRTSNLLVLIQHLSSPSQKLCFYLLVTAFANQVHMSAFHRIRHDNDFQHFRFSFWIQPPLAIFQLSCLSPVRPFRQISWWCPSERVAVVVVLVVTVDDVVVVVVKVDESRGCLPEGSLGTTTKTCTRTSGGSFFDSWTLKELFQKRVILLLSQKISPPDLLLNSARNNTGIALLAHRFCGQPEFASTTFAPYCATDGPYERDAGICLLQFCSCSSAQPAKTKQTGCVSMNSFLPEQTECI